MNTLSRTTVVGMLAIVMLLVMTSASLTAPVIDDSSGRPRSAPVSPPGPRQGPEAGISKDPATGLYVATGLGSVQDQAQRMLADAGPVTIGGPDDYGYRWDDGAPNSWIDASSGADTGVGNTTQFSGPIGIGFPFKYYENTYSQVYVSRHGYLSFNNVALDDSQSAIPNPGPPNNVIAPHWVPVDRVIGYVRHFAGGTAPNRWFAVEWNRVLSYSSLYTFEVVLYENGDIVFQYGSMSQDYGACQASGIEDSTGLDGLTITQFCARVGSYHSVRINRPTPAARVRLVAPAQGRFTSQAKTEVFQVPIRNTGELGTDTFDITSSSFWPMAIYGSDGTTPLADSDGDGAPDTGAVAQGGQTSVTVEVQTPVKAEIGANNTVTLIVRSSRDTNRSKSAVLQSAVPTLFAQAYRDTANPGMSLLLAQPSGQRAAQTGPAPESEMAVIEAANGNYFYVWQASTCGGSGCIVELYYTVLSHTGEILRPAGKLADLSGANETQDYSAALAATPDNRVAILWTRERWNVDTFTSNSNLYLAVLTGGGEFVKQPTNITLNDSWGGWDTEGVPRFYEPSISGTTDNRFFAVWIREHYAGQNRWVDDGYRATWDGNGQMLQQVALFAYDDPYNGSDYNWDTNVTQLRHNRVLITWRKNGDIWYDIRDSNGGWYMTKQLTNDGGNNNEWGQDAAGSDANILVAYTSQNSIYARLLSTDGSLGPGPIWLGRAYAPTGDGYVSVTEDSSHRFVVTWTDYDNSYRRNLYYALVGGNGTVLTPATIFSTSQAQEPYLITSLNGHGATTYSYKPNVVAPVGEPPAGGTVTNAGILTGYAIDKNSFGGTGVDAVRLYLDGPEGIGSYLGQAQYGLDRPDVGSYFGDPRFRPSGWRHALNAWSTLAGPHQLYVYVHRVNDEVWQQMPAHSIVVQPPAEVLFTPVQMRQ